jgi:hypothetical protein
VSSRKFEVRRLEIQFIKLLISVQLGDKIFIWRQFARHMELRKVIECPARRVKLWYVKTCSVN